MKTESVKAFEKRYRRNGGKMIYRRKNKEETVETILEEYVRPGLKSHGGGIVLEGIRNKTAYIRLTGHCSGCPSAKYTLENLVKEEVLKHTDLVEDVRLDEAVSQELYDFARQILSGSHLAEN